MQLHISAYIWPVITQARNNIILLDEKQLKYIRFPYQEQLIIFEEKIMKNPGPVIKWGGEDGVHHVNLHYPRHADFHLDSRTLLLIHFITNAFY